MKNNYCVYLHKTNKGKPFYIGHGTIKRANWKQGRSNEWNNVVNKEGLEVEIMFDNLDKEDAYDIEQYMIARIGLDKLVNKYYSPKYEESNN